jgi:hypothetical protein
MDNPWCRERVPFQELSKPIPWESAAPSRQPLPPDPCSLVGVPDQSSKVASYAVVGIVAPHHCGQMNVLLGYRSMPVLPAPVRNRRQRAGVTLLCRYLPHDVLAFPRLSPYVAIAFGCALRCTASPMHRLDLGGFPRSRDKRLGTGTTQQYVPRRRTWSAVGRAGEACGRL